jgi:xanthine/CO dehydrogenase XdhC/CoxF family maturation factor
MGLDIGAITPEEIAVAVVGEMIAVRRHADAPLPVMRYSLAEQAEPTPSTD